MIHKCHSVLGLQLVTFALPILFWVGEILFSKQELCVLYVKGNVHEQIRSLLVTHNASNVGPHPISCSPVPTQITARVER